MSEIEDRLRAAMQAAFELPPPGLIERVRSRHRRHVRRVAAGWVASVAVVAIAIPPVAHTLHAHMGQVSPASSGSVRTPSPSWSAVSTPPPDLPSVSPAAGTVLSSCELANAGAVGPESDWKPGSIEAGPLYFEPGGMARMSRGGDVGDRPELYVAIVVLAGLRPGSTVVLEATHAGRPFIRFLYGPNDSFTPGMKVTMRSGEAGVTFEACPRGTGFAPGQVVTDYYGGFVISGNRCVPVEVRAPGRSAPYVTDLGACRSA
jgi:hypothetical protein